MFTIPTSILCEANTAPPIRVSEIFYFHDVGMLGRGVHFRGNNSGKRPIGGYGTANQNMETRRFPRQGCQTFFTLMISIC